MTEFQDRLRIRLHLCGEHRDSRKECCSDGISATIFVFHVSLPFFPLLLKQNFVFSFVDVIVYVNRLGRVNALWAYESREMQGNGKVGRDRVHWRGPEPA